MTCFGGVSRFCKAANPDFSSGLLFYYMYVSAPVSMGLAVLGEQTPQYWLLYPPAAHPLGTWASSCEYLVEGFPGGSPQLWPGLRLLDYMSFKVDMSSKSG